jgi:hypothetical protein
MSVGTIIDSIVNQLLQYDLDGTNIVVNAQNSDITLSLIKSFYKTKIISIVEDETNLKKKILLLNAKLPAIRGKIEKINIDLTQKNIIYADIVKYISEQMIKINSLIIKSFTTETSLAEMNMLYEETSKLESNLITMCSQIKTSFSLQYENIIIARVNEQITGIDQCIEKICEEETYDVNEEVLVSYGTIAQLLKGMVGKFDKITNSNVKTLLANKIISSYLLYTKVFINQNTSNDINMLMISTIGKIKDLLIGDKFIIGYGEKKEITNVYRKYGDLENSIRYKIVSCYTIPIHEILLSCAASHSYTDCPNKIRNVLNKITFSNKINESNVIFVWNDIINTLVNSLIKSFIEYENIFTTDFISVADIVTGELIDVVALVFPKMEAGELVTYKTSIFSKTKTFIRFIKLCVSEQQELKKGDTKEMNQQFIKDFDKLKDEFAHLNAEFEKYCDGGTLFDYLKKMKGKSMSKLGDKKRTMESVGKKIVNVIKKF